MMQTAGNMSDFRIEFCASEKKTGLLRSDDGGFRAKAGVLLWLRDARTRPAGEADALGLLAHFAWAEASIASITGCCSRNRRGL